MPNARPYDTTEQARRGMLATGQPPAEYALRRLS